MNINGFSSQIGAFSGSVPQGGPGGVGGFPLSSQSQPGYPRNDSFESQSPRQTPGLGGVLRDSLQHAGVSQAKSKSVMDAVRNGTSLDSALQSAGVTPEQHRSVMGSVRAQDKRQQR